MQSEFRDPESANSFAQATLISYELHTLGWKAFQDLCLAIAEEILKRPVESFLPSRDGGRDGAFIGRWAATSATSSMEKSTIQCKFTSRRDAPLHLADVKGEVEKAQRLVDRGLATDYILITNYRISGHGAAEIARAFEVVGVDQCTILGSNWIEQQIRTSSRLRVMVPRVYGLGDLSQILDERAYAQSRAILSALGDDLSRFVITDAHRRSVRALLDHQFVLLLGDPASGKSTIAASLALGAVDHWGAPTIRISSPEELTQHWNPHEPKQFFWVDDAFGATQYQRQMVDAWNRQLPLMTTALRKGARFLLTSRTYIWRAAHQALKTSAFPLFDRSQVVIDVQSLLPREKAQILYNHIKLGDQSKKFRSDIKPHLAGLAADGSFLPETARRLGSQFFTSGLTVSQEGVLDFARRPVEFLKDVLRNLDGASAAAVALVFMHGGAVPSPIEADDRSEIVASLLGVPTSDLRNALEALRGSLVLLVEGPNGMRWTFKHPTVGDAYAALVADSPELTEIYLRGAKLQQLLKEVVCTGVDVEGAAVRVSRKLYPLLLNRIAERPIDYTVRYFLMQRCEREFLALVVDRMPKILSPNIHPFMAYDSEIHLLAKLHEFGLLTEDRRKDVVARVSELTVVIPDGAVLRDDDLRSLFTDQEFLDLTERIRTEVLGRLDDLIPQWSSDCHRDDDPESHFDEFVSLLKDAATQFENDSNIKDKIDAGLVDIKRAIEHLNEDREESSSNKVETPIGRTLRIADDLSLIFQDVDE